MAQDTIPEIRSNIEQSKDDLVRTAHEIEYRVEELKNWRTAVDRYPLAAVGVSVALGLMVSGAMPGLLRMAVSNAAPMARSSLIAYITSALKS